MVHDGYLVTLYEKVVVVQNGGLMVEKVRGYGGQVEILEMEWVELVVEEDWE